MTITINLAKLKSNKVGVTEFRTLQVLNALARLKALGRVDKISTLQPAKEWLADNGAEARTFGAFLAWCKGAQ